MYFTPLNELNGSSDALSIVGIKISCMVVDFDYELKLSKLFIRINTICSSDLSSQT